MGHDARPRNVLGTVRRQSLTVAALRQKLNKNRPTDPTYQLTGCTSEDNAQLVQLVVGAATRGGREATTGGAANLGAAGSHCNGAIQCYAT